MRKLTIDNFIDKANKVHNNKYDYSESIYINSNTKIVIRCPIHGNFQQNPCTHLQGNGCPECGYKKRSSNRIQKKKHHLQYLQNKFKDSYDFSKAVYKGRNNFIILICPKHGEFRIKINNALSNNFLCKKCYKESLRSNSVEFINKANKVHNNKYDYSKVNYKSSSQKVIIKCPMHGEFLQRPNGHLRGAGCPSCSILSRKEKVTKSLNDFIDKANKVHNNKYDYSKSVYINSNSKIEIICPIHGSFWQCAYNHLKGNGCPNCKSSMGEVIIRNYLESQNISFETQKTFKNCKDLKALRFDFYLLDYDLCIEYDGIQHFKPIKSFGGVRGFEATKSHDIIKNNYCIAHNINLLRIPYYRKASIEDMIDNCLKEICSE